MKYLIILLLLYNSSINAQNYSFSTPNNNKFKQHFEEKPNLDLSLMSGVKNKKVFIGFNLEYRQDFQSLGIDFYLQKYFDTTTPCFLCHKNILKLQGVGYYTFGLPLTFIGEYPNKKGSTKYIVGGRIDTNADISAVFKVNLKKLKVKLLLGQSSGFQLHFLFF